MPRWRIAAGRVPRPPPRRGPAGPMCRPDRARPGTGTRGRGSFRPFQSPFIDAYLTVDSDDTSVRRGPPGSRLPNVHRLWRRPPKMIVMSRRAEMRELRHAEILAAAASMIADLVFHVTSLENICQAIGISAPVLYL